MNMFILRLECIAPDASDAQLEEDFSEIADAFYEVDGLIDPDLELDITTNTLTFSMIVEAPNEGDAMMAGLSAARTALHMAGKGTPGWEEHYRLSRQNVERQMDGEHISA
jgi:hypothetical protein